jgi:predicted DNA-binding transcriptional regulator YafY
MRIDRLLAMTVMMLNRERVSARELAEKFEISVRSVYRDLDAMGLAGIPVLSYAGHGGGFGLQENYKIDRRLLSAADINAILVSLASIRRSLPQADLDATMEKIASLLPESQRSGAFQLEQVVIDTLSWGGSPALNDKIALIHRAIATSRCLEFEYSTGAGVRSARRVEPMTLFFKGYSWYLFAFCLERRDYRFFRVTRLKSPRLAEAGFTRRAASYRAYLPTFAPAEPAREMVLEFAAADRQMAEDTFDGEQISLLADGRVRVALRMPEDHLFYSMILSFGEHVTVISPAHVRQTLAKKIKKIASLYKPDIMVSQPPVTMPPSPSDKEET